MSVQYKFFDSLQVHYIFIIISKYKRDLEIVIFICFFSSNSAEMQVTAQDGEAEKTKSEEMLAGRRKREKKWKNDKTLQSY